MRRPACSARGRTSLKGSELVLFFQNPVAADGLHACVASSFSTVVLRENGIVPKGAGLRAQPDRRFLGLLARIVHESRN